MRVLIITENTAYLDPNTKERAHLLDHIRLVGETHMIVLTKHGAGLTRDQLAPNLWLYTTDSRFLWHAVAEAVELAAELPTPDLIVCEDPFRAGKAGVKIAKAKRVPLQVHISRSDLHNEPGAFSFLRSRLGQVKYVIAEASCLRADNISTLDMLKKLNLMRGKQTAVVPMVVFEQRAPQGTFPVVPNENDHPELQFKVFVHITEHTNLGKGNMFEVFHELAAIYRWIGMVVVGSAEAQTRAKKYLTHHGGSDRIFFRLDPDELMHSLEIAQAVLITDPNTVDDEVLRAALAAGRALIMPESMASTELRAEEQCLTCAFHDAECFIQKVRTVVENNALRLRLEVAAREVDTMASVTNEERLLRLKQSYTSCAARELS